MADQRELRRELGRITKEFLKLVKGELQQHSSSKFAIEGTQETTFTLFTPSHIQWAAYGRGSGKAPPFQDIFDFVKKKNIQFKGLSQESTAWAIVKSIAKNGTKNFKPNAPDVVLEAIDKFDKDYQDKMNDFILENTFKNLELIYEDAFPRILKYKI